MNFRRYAAPLAATGAVTVLAVGIVGAQNSGTSSNTPAGSTTAGAPAHGVYGGGLTDAYLEALAGNLGVSVDDLKADLAKTSTDWIDAALNAGTITEDEANDLKALVTEGNYLAPIGQIERENARAEAEAQRDALVESIANYLGLSTDELEERVGAGASLAAIAETESKDVDGLKTLIQDSLEARIEAAVDDGRITEDAATDLKNMLSDRVDDIVTGEGWFRLGISGPGRGYPGFGGRNHHGFGSHGFGGPGSWSDGEDQESAPDTNFSGF